MVEVQFDDNHDTTSDKLLGYQEISNPRSPGFVTLIADMLSDYIRLQSVEKKW